MKIALIGATGFVGTAIVKEALERGHEVTAIARNPEKVEPRRNLQARKADVYHANDLRRILPGHDVISSAFSPNKNDPDIRHKHVQGFTFLIETMKGIGPKRLLVVGGAGGLEVKPGLRGIDTPEFPEQWKGTARATADVLQLLRRDQELEWTFLSPAALLQPGTRTGTFRLGTDRLLVAPDGQSTISLEDYAIAMIDEMENPRHIRQRFTVGY